MKPRQMTRMAAAVLGLMTAGACDPPDGNDVGSTTCAVSELQMWSEQAIAANVAARQLEGVLEQARSEAERKRDALARLENDLRSADPEQRQPLRSSFATTEREVEQALGSAADVSKRLHAAEQAFDEARNARVRLGAKQPCF